MIKLTKIFSALLLLKLIIFAGFAGLQLAKEISPDAAAKTEVDVSTNTRTRILKDSDGDGLLDSEDPHPDIAEVFIVEDENRNGIVDLYE